MHIPTPRACVAALSLWIAACSTAWAQAPDTDTPPPAPTKGEAKALRDFKMLDFNGDGKLSRTEVKLFPRLSAAFDDADTNHDNYVSYEEVREFAAKYRAERDRQKAAQAAQAPVQEAPAIQSAPLKAE